MTNATVLNGTNTSPSPKPCRMLAMTIVREDGSPRDPELVTTGLEDAADFSPSGGAT